ncbi:hypothetical protein LBMAG53_01150 [Planctomycetota bacterium]|nr:hypothetical protein LBMAG53_01150 [Planctomycetota bacterium]
MLNNVPEGSIETPVQGVNGPDRPEPATNADHCPWVTSTIPMVKGAGDTNGVTADEDAVPFSVIASAPDTTVAVGATRRK